jgi:type III pantothenate kinase
MILALDIGNSRAKWGLHADGRWLAKGSVPSTQIATLADAWPAGLSAERAIAANVAGKAAQDAADAALARHGLTATWVRATKTCAGVKNGYRVPERLGADRWAALVAARALFPDAPCIVACAGTALTVDALDGAGNFLGGLIVPGLGMLMRALADTLPQFHSLAAGHDAAFPDTTEDAIHGGRLAALAGSVLLMRQRLATRVGSEPACLISGGDAALLAPQLPFSARLVETLVLDGLVRIAQS